MPDQFNPRLSTAAREAVSTACDRQLESVQYQLDRQQLCNFEECREIVRDWVLDECLVIDLDLEQCLRLVEQFATELDLEIGTVTPENLRRRIDTLAAVIVHEFGEQRALHALEEIEQFLDERDLSIEDLRSLHPFATLPPHDEYDEDDWHVLKYHNPDGSERNVNVYAYTLGSFRCYIKEWLEEDSQKDSE